MQDVSVLHEKCLCLIYFTLIWIYLFSTFIIFFQEQLKLLNFNCVCDNSNFKVYGIPLLTELPLNNINFRVIHHMLYLSKRMAKFVLWVFFFF